MRNQGFMWTGDEFVQVRFESIVPPDQFISYLSKNNIPALYRDNHRVFLALPSNTRFHYPSNKQYHNIIVEVRPGIKLFNHERLATPKKLLMPWQYFTFTCSHVGVSPYNPDGWSISDVKLSWSPERATNINSVVYRPLLPNISGDHVICLGDTIPDSMDSIQQAMEDIVAGFYSVESTFNDDLSWRIPAFAGYSSNPYELTESQFNQVMRVWQASSRSDDLFYKKYNLYSALPISSLLQVPEVEKNEEETDSVPYNYNTDFNRLTLEQQATIAEMRRQVNELLNDIRYGAQHYPVY